MGNNEAIKYYISSSEFNRLKKNGVNIFEPRDLWIDVLKETWLTRKLRRKIGHLFQMDLLPTLQHKRVLGLSDFTKLAAFYKLLKEDLANQLMKAEDEAIMKGLGL